MIKPNYISYKDMAARVVKEGNIFHRYIFKNYENEYEHLMNSGLYEELSKKGLLISHSELPITNKDPKVYKHILPSQLTFQSYPFEWSYTQWRKVVQAYLKITKIALKYDMILKDATPYNFSFEGGNAVLFDTSSFIFFHKGDKWLAYKQFCELILSPLTLMYYNGVTWGKLYQSSLQGLNLDFVSKQLPLKSWFNSTVLFHIHLHAKFANKSRYENYQEFQGGFSKEKVNLILSHIDTQIKSWNMPHGSKNHWVNYYKNDIEEESYILSKEKAIRNWISSTNPQSVLDLGANVGKFSFIASEYAEKVISIESDEICVDEIDKLITLHKIKNVYPVIGDLSQPSPGLGLLNNETLPLFERAESDMVLSLALIHHLYFTKFMDFEVIFELFSKFTKNYLIVEFIPNLDRKVKVLMLGKSARAEGYNYELFMKNIHTNFELIEQVKLDFSSRTLLLLRKKYGI